MASSSSSAAFLPHSAPQPDASVNGASAPERDLRALVGGFCGDCGTGYSARDAVVSIFLGLRNAPRCLACVSRKLERDPSQLRADVLAHLLRRDCYLQAWREAERIDGANQSDNTAAAPSPAAEDNRLLNSVLSGNGTDVLTTAEWDAGDMGCGELVMALRLRMKNLPAGGVIKVSATDPAAPEDLPAWCRLCGHTLVAMTHPNYWIRRKGE